jgi:transglutaminase-like putative cysteine protease
MKKTIVLSLLASLLAASCGGSHFLADSSYRGTVHKDYQSRMKATGGHFTPGISDMTQEEKEALEFLYAYMPLADVADYSAEFFLANVRKSLQAREEMGWNVPEREFRHFVLPLRTNNEDLDSARLVFYDELKAQVQGMSMKEAILEVNHWCHEKMTYQPSDGRTHAPLASVKNALGRCGEESTFCVAALRCVGIPARQVYTPRWAHTESNHAWVEAWADGEWVFLGACEPEPVLNLGWFNAPASRAMLTHTKVFGKYDGPEEVVLRTPGYTEINLIENYAKAAQIAFRVMSTEGKPVAGARVDFCIYNSSQFYPAVSKYTDADGRTALSAGLGDMLVWASKDGAYGYVKVHFGKDTEATVTLDSPVGVSDLLAIVPPPEDVVLPTVTPEQRAENDRRMAYEDSVRKAYMAGFPNRETASAFVAEQGLPPQAVRLVEGSAGNGATIMGFLHQAQDKDRAVRLLSSLSQKDLTDVPAIILWDSYNATESILSPRIESEFLSPYKGWFLENVPADLQEAFRGGGDPGQGARAILAWIRDNVTVDEDPLFWDIPISPAGVWKGRVANPRSRDLLAIALGRTFGVELRRDRLSGAMQYNAAKAGEEAPAGGPGFGPGPGAGPRPGGPMPGGPFGPRGDWRTIDLASATDVADAPTGHVQLVYEPVEGIERPQFGTHFSLSRIVDGRPQAVGFGMGGRRGGANEADLPEGDYLLCSGNRLSDGSTPVTVNLFHVAAGETLQVPLVIETVLEEVKEQGTFAPVGALSGVDGWYAAAVLDVGLEPTNHLLNDLSAARAALESWGRPIYLVTTSEAQLERLHSEIDSGRFGTLPSTVVYCIDTDGSVLTSLCANLPLRADQLPLVIVANASGPVVFASQGYTIGLGARIAALARKL